MRMKKTLIVLDLDHTLVYGSYESLKNGMVLLQYSRYLMVYMRPYAHEFTEACRQSGDIIVYTNSLRKYARKICSALNIHPVELLSRKQCYNPQFPGKVIKTLNSRWLTKYSLLVVIDDSPGVWVEAENERVKFIVPPEFHGEVTDVELFKAIEKLKVLIEDAGLGKTD